MERTWEYTVDYSYEGQYALGMETAKVRITQRLYEYGLRAEQIALLTTVRVSEIAGHTKAIYAVQ